MIDGIQIHPLKVFPDERGKVMHMLRSDAPFFEEFGEVYFSLVNANIVKGWKQHKKMTQHFAVPIGNMKIVFYDDRKESPTYKKIQEVSIGEDNYQLIKVPPMIWYAFGALNNKKALLTNCADMPHDPEESATLELSDKTIPYSWEKDK